MQIASFEIMGVCEPASLLLHDQVKNGDKAKYFFLKYSLHKILANIKIQEFGWYTFLWMLFPFCKKWSSQLVVMPLYQTSGLQKGYWSRMFASGGYITDANI